MITESNKRAGLFSFWIFEWNCATGCNVIVLHSRIWKEPFALLLMFVLPVRRCVVSGSGHSARFTPLSLLQLRHDTLVNLIEHLSSLHHNYIGMGSYVLRRNVSLISGYNFVQWRPINCWNHMAYNVVCVVPTPDLKKVRYFFYPMLPDFRNSIAFRKVPRLWRFVLLKIRIGHWWNDDDRESPKHSAKKLSQCHSAHYISHTDWHGIEPGPPW